MSMNKSVLVVDDSGSVRTVVGMALRTMGYEVIEAGNGAEALQRLDGRRFNLIISDVNMPVMDGLTLLREVKKHPNHRFTPVIMLTTESGEDKKAQGKAGGAKAWMTKPFRPEQMVQAVQKLVMP